MYLRNGKWQGFGSIQGKVQFTGCVLNRLICYMNKMVYKRVGFAVNLDKTETALFKDMR